MVNLWRSHEAKGFHIYPDSPSFYLDIRDGSTQKATRPVWGDGRGYNFQHAPSKERSLCFTYYFTNHGLVYQFALSVFRDLFSTPLPPGGVLRFHSHPQLLVPEQQFASGFVELQPVNLGVMADGSQIVAFGQVHWGGGWVGEEEKWWVNWAAVRLLVWQCICLKLAFYSR